MRPFANMKIAASSLVKVCLSSWLFLVLAFAQGVSPVPQIANPLVPTAVTPGSPAFTLTVNGTGFVSGSTVYWNGSPRTTTYVSAAGITAAITAADVAAATSGTITVHQPSGVVSAPAYFLVTAPVASLGFGALATTPIVRIQETDTLAADFNGDGNPDVYIDQGDSVLVALGDGDGSIQAPITYSVNGSPRVQGSGTVVADLSNNGLPDVVFPTYDANGMQVMLDNASAVLTTGALLNLSSDQSLGTSTVAADINGDGKLDLVFTANGAVGTALGNGDGTFQAPLYVPTPYTSEWVVVADFNRDGIPDIAAVMYDYGLVNEVVVLIGHGDGTFASAVGYNTTLWYRPTSADLNGDGFPDLIGIDQSGYAIDVMLNAGDGTFLPAVSYSGPDPNNYVAFGAVAVGDMNGDGKPDVVAENEQECTNNCIEIFPGNGDGTLQTGTLYGIQQNVAGIEGGEISLADFNHDGKLDITTPWTDGSYLMIQTTGVAPTLNPGMLTFGSQAVGSESQPQTTELYPPGNAAITVYGASVTGDYVMGYDGCENVVLGPGNSSPCPISVSFQPTTTGLRTGTLIVTSSGGTQNLSLSGTGTAALNLSVTPSSINFGTVGLESTSYTQYVYITNTGSQTINISSIGLTGTNPGDFIVSNPCGSSLNVGASCSVKINFKPTAAGLRSATLSVADNATNSPQTVALSGTGSALHVSEYLLNYGNVTVGTSSSQVLTLRNLGTRTISVGQFKFVGYAAADYSQTNTCGGGIPARSNCTITVTFTPQTQGLLDSVLNFSTNGTVTQAVTSISLKGRGQ